MPYIEQGKLRKELAIGKREPQCFGELNYVISNKVHQFIKRIGVSYGSLNSAIGVLECAKLELYRIVAARYENKKRIENGSVSDLDTLTLEDVR